MTLQERIGKAVAIRRKAKGLTQEQFANEAMVDRRYMSDIENGKRNLSLDVLERIASYFGMRVSDLIRAAEDVENTPLTLAQLKERLCDSGYEDSLVFENPDYVSAFVAVTSDGRVVYSFEKMVEHLVDSDGMTCDEAYDFVSYNTLRALPYMGDKGPLVICDLD